MDESFRPKLVAWTFWMNACDLQRYTQISLPIYNKKPPKITNIKLKLQYKSLTFSKLNQIKCLRCFDTVGWASG